MAAWPRINVVTPCYNSARLLDDCIRSVLDAEYEPIKYTVIEGCSTEGSVDIIRKHETQCAYWHSRADRGQAHPINLGLAR